MGRRYAVASGQRWVILSAAHGVIDPDVVIRPYDAKLPEERQAIARWARTAAIGIERIWLDSPVERLMGTPVEIIAGVAYGAPLARELEALDIPHIQPLVGLGTGQRLRRLREMIDGKKLGGPERL
jgi:hypothetical protein